MRSDIMNRPLEDLIRIIQAGGGITVDGTRPTEELIKIAAAASAGKAKVIMAESEYKTADDLIRIAKAGGGNVVFQ